MTGQIHVPGAGHGERILEYFGQKGGQVLFTKFHHTLSKEYIRYGQRLHEAGWLSVTDKKKKKKVHMRYFQVLLQLDDSENTCGR